MLKYWKHAAVLIVLVAYVVGFWLWKSHGFPTDINTCQHTAANGQCENYAPEHIYLFLFGKIGEALNNLNFISALATLAIAGFTGTLWWSTRGLLRATNESINLARNEFLASHRPRLRLKHIWFCTPDGQRFSGFPQPNTQIVVLLDIVNIGNSVAYLDHINAIAAAIPYGQRLPQRPPYNEPGVPKIPLYGLALKSGITYPRIVPLGGIPISQQTIDRIRNGTDRLYIVGTIAYWWGIGEPNARQTAFCRYLDFEWPPRRDDAGRFEIENDPDYEYQD